MAIKSRDEEGRPLEIERWGSNLQGPGVSTTFAYDGHGRVIEETNGGVTKTLQRDSAGNVITEITGGDTITMKYDVLNRLELRVTPAVTYAEQSCSIFHTGLCGAREVYPLYPNATDSSSFTVPIDSATFAYDSGGGLIQANNRDARITRSYFGNGQVKTDSVWIRSYSMRTTDPVNVDSQFTLAFGLRYAYDRDGRRTRLFHPTNLLDDSVVYTYDSRGMLATVRALSDSTYSFLYDSPGRDSLRTYPGGGRDSLVYDPNGRLLRRKQRTTSQGTFRDEVYRFDARDKLISLTISGNTSQYFYSGLGSLVGADVQTGLSPVHKQEWQVDELGSILANRIHGTFSLWRESTYDAEQLTESLTELPGSPSNGMVRDSLANEFQTGRVIRNQTHTETFGSGVWNDLTDVYTRSYFGRDGRMRAHQRYVTNAGSATTDGAFQEQRYDALGRRVLLRVRRDSLCNIGHCSSAVERYLWDGDQLLWEMRAPASDTESGAGLEATTGTGDHYGRVVYTHGPGLDRPLEVGRSGSINTSIIPHADWRGQYDRGTTLSGADVTADIDWPGEDTRSFLDEDDLTPSAWDWYGSLILDQQDATGLVYRRNRYYDPGTGRFTQQDPIGIVGGLNLYGFTDGDPVNFSDPFGLCPQWLTGRPCGGAVDLAAGSVPGLSTGLDVATALSGENPLTGEEVGSGGRLIATAGVVLPVSSAQIRGLGRIGSKVLNQLSHVDRSHLSIAARELRGLETVAGIM